MESYLELLRASDELDRCDVRSAWLAVPCHTTILAATALSETEKAVWVIVIVLAPLLGSIAWYVAGPHPFGIRLTHSYR
ncbi:PLD nuclease N-terminal domain-containing protein [Cryobacterium tepidiphilum]|uniref:PLDc_N domain-containing protein n=1 Tax=Cryobacterium tepidiphilum TaxID=2486026 RepID=A0A3M8LG83_9MICO|nr:PLDc_N domain-containing protein [Cryobacterium tepidiphilum]